MRVDLIPKSFVPEEPIQDLRELTRLRKMWIESRNREKNRAHKILQTAGIKLTSYMTDIVGLSGRNLLNLLINEEEITAEKVEVYWAGQTLKLINPITGKEFKAYLFVSTLPYSRYSYVEVTGDMRQESWINAHVNMYQHFGGVTPLLICDNLKTGVIKHPRHGDIILNATYRELAGYYDTAILQAKPRTPKGKPSVEGTVGNVSRLFVK